MRVTLFALATLGCILFTNCNTSKQAATSSQESASTTTRTSEGRPERSGQSATDRQAQFEAMAKEVGLTAEQQEQLLAINEEFRTEMRAMRENGGGDRMAMREKMMTMRDEQLEKVKAILTEEQFEKYQAYVEANRPQRRRGGGF